MEGGVTARFWTEEVKDRLEMLHCVMGLDHKDIASALGSTPKAVEFQINMLGLRRTPQAVQAQRARGLRRWINRTRKGVRYAV